MKPIRLRRVKKKPIESTKHKIIPIQVYYKQYNTIMQIFRFPRANYTISGYVAYIYERIMHFHQNIHTDTYEPCMYTFQTGIEEPADTYTSGLFFFFFFFQEQSWPSFSSLLFFNPLIV